MSGPLSADHAEEAKNRPVPQTTPTEIFADEVVGSEKLRRPAGVEKEVWFHN